MSTSLYTEYETDKTVESEGIEVIFGEDSVFTLSRAGGSNAAYKKLFKRLLKPHQRLLDTGKLSEEIQTDILAEVYAKTVVLGWKTGIEGDNKKITFKSAIQNREGKWMKFSEEACKQLLIDLPELFTQIQGYATEFSNFQAEQEAEDVKP